jgi:hypothetical protein
MPAPFGWQPPGANVSVTRAIDSSDPSTTIVSVVAAVTPGCLHEAVALIR